ncbi:MAG: hypothetical protein ACK5Q5_20010 [Planctomycetaceae bacterium]
MLNFKPALWRSGELFELPRPVTSVRVQDSWDFAKFKVPLAAGDATTGHSRNGVDIAIEGRCGTHAGELTIDETGMFGALELLRSRLHVPSGEIGFELFLYHDPTASHYRSFRRCSTVRFDYDLSDAHLYSYSLVIHASDATLYSSPPA